MRVFQCDGLDGEAVTEIERGWIERQIVDCSPQIELIARPPAVKALEEIARNVNREAATLL